MALNLCLLEKVTKMHGALWFLDNVADLIVVSEHGLYRVRYAKGHAVRPDDSVWHCVYLGMDKDGHAKLFPDDDV